MKSMFRQENLLLCFYECSECCSSFFLMRTFARDAQMDRRDACAPPRVDMEAWVDMNIAGTAMLLL